MNKSLCIALLCLAAALCATCAAANRDPAVPGDYPTPAVTPSATDTPELVREPESEPGTLSLEVTCGGSGITYVYVNNTDETARVLGLPRLARFSDGVWEDVPVCEGVMFCGTPDYIAAKSRSMEWTLDTQLLYGGELEPGLYRLSFNTVDEDYVTIGDISAEFNVDGEASNLIICR